MRHKFTVSQFSGLFGISADTLRHYDRLGLLEPETNPHTGYRYYGIRSFFKLSRILFLKQLGVSLDEIKDFVGNRNVGTLLSTLERKELELELQIQHLEAVRSKLKGKLKLLREAEQQLDTITVRSLPERRGILLDLQEFHDTAQAKDALTQISGLLHHSSWLFEGQVYTLVERQNILRGEFDRYLYFIELTEPNLLPGMDLKTLPAQDYACTVIKGSYSHFDRHYRTLLQWIDSEGYVVDGDSIDKNIVDYDFSDLEDEYISEIQIPVRKHL